MIKYFCDGCNNVITNNRYTMQVLKPDGEKMPNRHYCLACWKVISSRIKDGEKSLTMDVKENEEEISEELTPIENKEQFVPDSRVAENQSDIVVTNKNGKELVWFFKNKDDIHKLDGRMEAGALQKVLSYIYTHDGDTHAIIAKNTGITYASVNNWHSRFYSSDRKDELENTKYVTCDGVQLRTKDILIFISAGRDDKWIALELGVREDFIHLVRCYYTGIVNGYSSFKDFIDKTDELIV